LWRGPRRFEASQMTVSGTDHGGAPRSGSLLSLAPRQARRPKAAPSPMLSALARVPAADIPAVKPADADIKPAKRVDAAAAPRTSHNPAAVQSVPPEETQPVKTQPATDLPKDAPAPEVSSNEASSNSPPPGTANSLVARLRRQFMEGLPQGREGAAGSPEEPTATHPVQEHQRSALEEVRFRLREFHAEILARAANRPSDSYRP
jgi:hypothetical protein